MRVLRDDKIGMLTYRLSQELKQIPVAQRLSLAEIACGLIMEKVRESLPAPEHPVGTEIADLFAEPAT